MYGPTISVILAILLIPLTILVMMMAWVFLTFSTEEFAQTQQFSGWETGRIGTYAAVTAILGILILVLLPIFRPEYAPGMMAVVLWLLGTLELTLIYVGLKRFAAGKRPILEGIMISLGFAGNLIVIYEVVTQLVF